MEEPKEEKATGEIRETRASKKSKETTVKETTKVTRKRASQKGKLTFNDDNEEESEAVYLLSIFSNLMILITNQTSS